MSEPTTINFAALPEYTGSASTTIYFVGVVDSSETYIVPISGVTAGFVHFQDTPAGTVDAPTLSWDSTGIWSCSSDGWGKTPRYTNNIDDLDDNVRFVIVDKPQGLSTEEQRQGRLNLGFDQATTEKAGLVRVAPGIQADEAGVVTAAQVASYLSGTFAGSVRFEILSSEEQLPSVYVSGVVYVIKSSTDDGYDQYTWSQAETQYIKVGTAEIKGLTITDSIAASSTNDDAAGAEAVYAFVTSSAHTFSLTQTFAQGLTTSYVSTTGDLPTGATGISERLIRLDGEIPTISFGISATAPTLFEEDGKIKYKVQGSLVGGEIDTVEARAAAVTAAASTATAAAVQTVKESVKASLDYSSEEDIVSAKGIADYVGDVTSSLEETLKTYADDKVSATFPVATTLPTTVAPSSAAVSAFVTSGIADAFTAKTTTEVTAGSNKLVTSGAVATYGVPKSDRLATYSAYLTNYTSGEKVVSAAVLTRAVAEAVPSVITKDITFSKGTTFSGAASFSGAVTFNTVTTTGRVTAASIATSGELIAYSDTYFSGDVHFARPVYASDFTLTDTTLNGTTTLNDTVIYSGVQVSPTYASLNTTSVSTATAVSYAAGTLVNNKHLSLTLAPSYTAYTTITISVASNNTAEYNQKAAEMYIYLPGNIKQGTSVTVTMTGKVGASKTETFTVDEANQAVVLRVVQSPTGRLALADITNRKIESGGGGSPYMTEQEFRAGLKVTGQTQAFNIASTGSYSMPTMTGYVADASICYDVLTPIIGSPSSSDTIKFNVYSYDATQGILLSYPEGWSSYSKVEVDVVYNVNAIAPYAPGEVPVRTLSVYDVTPADFNRFQSYILSLYSSPEAYSPEARYQLSMDADVHTNVPLCMEFKVLPEKTPVLMNSSISMSYMV